MKPFCSLLKSRKTVLGLITWNGLTLVSIVYAASDDNGSLWVGQFSKAPVLATLAGVIPISFLLAHFGRELRSTDMYSITLTVPALGMFTLIPIAIKSIN